MQQEPAEGAVNAHGMAAIIVASLAFPPSLGRVTGRRVVLEQPGGPLHYSVAREVADAAARNGEILVIEMEGGNLVRDTRVPVPGPSPR